MHLNLAPLILALSFSTVFAIPVDPPSEADILDRRLFSSKAPTVAAKPVIAAKPPKVVASKPAAPAKPPVVAPAKAPVAPAKPPAATKPAAPPKAPVASTTKAAAPVKSTSRAPTSSSSTSTASACPKLPKSTVLPRAPSVRDELENLVKRHLDEHDLSKRLTAGNEFIGWHGTNSDTAALWEKTGSVVKPVRDDGSVAGTSGLDAELGPGLYISDTLSVAEAAATINAKTNAASGATAKACAIFAKSSVNWRGTVVKAQIPESIRGNGAQFETMRQRYLPLLGRPGGAASPRLGPLSATKNQMLIPEVLNPGLEAQCFDVVNLVAQNVPASIPTISYTSASILSSWLINKNDEQLATAVKASVLKKC
ncbi:hypothetical protein DL93DRAFT_2231705 [Clavulina sp. PMI_390]|nr:hypothetical protein DL93DRAFT_2231705 [Clavulina sp. PMI_390]